MDDHTANELDEALRPLASLISKSEKAQRHVAPETWQHAMLQDNLTALRHAYALMSGRRNAAADVTRDDALEALQAFASMIMRTEEAQAKFEPGTSQHTLLRNRLHALRIGEALMRAEAAEEAGTAE